MTRHDSDGLWSLARGTLEREESERVRAHVNGCAECAALLAQIERAQPALQAFAPPKLGEAVWQELDRNVLRGAESVLQKRAARGRIGWLGWLLAGAGTLAVALLLVLRVVEPVPQAKTAQTQPAAAPQRETQIETRAGEETELMLGKARVLVLSSSRVQTSEHGPLTLVQGTLVIAAEATQAGELTVRAGDIDVVVTGTQALVHREADQLDVAVAEGQVRVRRATQERTVVAASALTVERDQWTLRPATPVEQAALQRVMPRAQHEAPVPAPAPKPRTNDRAPAPRAREPEATEPAPALPAPSEAAPVAPEPLPENAPPAPAPGVQDAGSKAAEGKPGWRTHGVNDVSRTVTDLLPGRLKPGPAQKLDQDEYLLRKMERLASTGDCAHAFTQADAWLKVHPVAADDSAELEQLRSAVHNVYTRCKH
jgi:ferric-dicitrate binding protein FerR (iron transport regulator)